MTLQFLALIMGPLMIALFLPGMLYPKESRKFFKELLKDTMLLRITGLITFLIGMVVINVEYRIFKDWEALMVVFGYGAVLKGLVYMWWPKSIAKMFNKHSDASFGLCAALAFVVGVLLCYLGAYIY